ncbi:hypothetical protein HCH_05738 [Hahella chejuensis KCTC 2396]|uniref:Uncharacterized protein n=1 Tax=Hahella chejuensis (strain KCTC 2396) TaxID=349521 RepID=Q2SAD3_HAHCH|nr:hypothetical protein HCH_05738 [Hahella chejuensis KCTC 2396]
MVAFRKISAADGAIEQNVAHQRQPRALMEKNHMSGRMSRAVQHLQRFLADADFIALVQPAIRGKLLRCRKAEHHALLRQGIDPEFVLIFRPFDRNFMSLRQLRSSAGVIYVSMGQQHFLQRQPVAGQYRFDFGEIAAWVHHSSLTRFFTPEHGAVLNKRGNGHNFVFHDYSLNPSPTTGAAPFYYTGSLTQPLDL